MKNITFIGGSGFFGKSFIDGFNRGVLKTFKIKKIYIISRNPRVLKKHKELNFKNVELIRGDISKMKKLPKTNLIIYGAENVAKRFYKNKKKIIKTHKKSIDNFCELLKNHEKCKVLYLGSGAVYKNKSNKKSLYGYMELYSHLKNYSEKKIMNISNKNIKTSIARCFSFIGPWLPLNQHYAIGNFIYDGFYSDHIRVKTTQKVIRSYMYADDLIFWLVKILKSSENKTSIFNVGSDKSIEIVKLAKIIGKIFDKPVKSPKIIGKRVDKYVPNIHKVKRHLKLRINYDLMKSLLLTITRINEKIN